MYLIPKTIFVIPYRDRLQHKKSYCQHMKKYISNKCYKFLFIHQNNSKRFNRGAIKNIGFLVIKELYPLDYKNINIVFNDIDTFPKTNDSIDFETEKNKVIHLFGFDFTLGGIFIIKGCDFEKIGGFPNYWGWGCEDNLLNDRCLHNNIEIDRSKINCHDIVQLKHGSTVRSVSIKEARNYGLKQEYETFNDIKNLKYSITGNMVHVHTFQCINNDDNPDMDYQDIDLAKTGNKIPITKNVNKKLWKLY